MATLILLITHVALIQPTTHHLYQTSAAADCLNVATNNIQWSWSMERRSGWSEFTSKYHTIQRTVTLRRVVTVLGLLQLMNCFVSHTLMMMTRSRAAAPAVLLLLMMLMRLHSIGRCNVILQLYFSYTAVILQLLLSAAPKWDPGSSRWLLDASSHGGTEGRHFGILQAHWPFMWLLCCGGLIKESHCSVKIITVINAWY